jgi:hypothetical protein
MSKCKCGHKLPKTDSLLNDLKENILANSFIKQEEFAFSAALVLMATLSGRKFVFSGLCSNLYILNVAPSGSGKDAPQQKLKEFLLDLRADNLLGAGDYVSDASLMDSLGYKPVRLDIMDEMGGILRSINSGKAEYNSKMADVLAELYTSSNSKFLGRQTAEGNKGECYRPNVNILGSTTPTGFQEGVSKAAIEKGLMGRFLIFLGDGHKPAERVRKFTRLNSEAMDRLRYILSIEADEEGTRIGGIRQDYIEVEADKKANDLLDKIFRDFDNLRMETDSTSALLPIIARLYQQMCKITLIHSVSRVGVGEMPKISVEDVQFGYETILYYFSNIEKIVEKYIHEGFQEKKVAKFLNVLEENGGKMTKSLLAKRTRWMNKRERDAMLIDLAEMGDIIVESASVEGRNQTIIRLV